MSVRSGTQSLTRVHVGAMMLFLLAVVCYLLAWIPGAFVLGFLGLLLEGIGWFVLLTSRGVARGSAN